MLNSKLKMSGCCRNAHKLKYFEQYWVRHLIRLAASCHLMLTYCFVYSDLLRDNYNLTTLSTNIQLLFNNAVCFNDKITLRILLRSFLQWTTLLLNPQFLATLSHSVPGFKPWTSWRKASSRTLFSSFVCLTSSLYFLYLKYSF